MSKAGLPVPIKGRERIFLEPWVSLIFRPLQSDDVSLSSYFRPTE
jgi:hypothetical protein